MGEGQGYNVYDNSRVAKSGYSTAPVLFRSVSSVLSIVLIVGVVAWVGLLV